MNVCNQGVNSVLGKVFLVDKFSVTLLEGCITKEKNWRGGSSLCPRPQDSDGLREPTLEIEGKLIEVCHQSSGEIITWLIP